MRWRPRHEAAKKSKRLLKNPDPLFYEDMFYGDFEIRLLEPFKPGHMQAACIVEAHNLIRHKWE
jgi:hypothetical protein